MKFPNGKGCLETFILNSHFLSIRCCKVIQLKRALGNFKRYFLLRCSWTPYFVKLVYAYLLHSQVKGNLALYILLHNEQDWDPPCQSVYITDICFVGAGFQILLDKTLSWESTFSMDISKNWNYPFLHNGCSASVLQPGILKNQSCHLDKYMCYGIIKGD